MVHCLTYNLKPLKPGENKEKDWRKYCKISKLITQTFQVLSYYKLQCTYQVSGLAYMDVCICNFSLIVVQVSESVSYSKRGEGINAMQTGSAEAMSSWRCLLTTNLYLQRSIIQFQLHDAAPLSAVLCATLHSVCVCAHVCLSGSMCLRLRLCACINRSVFIYVCLQTCLDANEFLCLKASFVQ